MSWIDSILKLLRKGGVQKNANLAAVMPDLKEIIAVSEIADLLEREKHIDLLRWQWIDETVRFRYFELENV